jgi:hypothetical protein
MYKLVQQFGEKFTVEWSVLSVEHIQLLWKKLGKISFRGHE